MIMNVMYHVEHVTTVHDTEQVSNKQGDVLVALNCTLEFTRTCNATAVKNNETMKQTSPQVVCSALKQTQDEICDWHDIIPIVAFSASARKRSCKWEVRKLVSFFRSNVKEEENQLERSWGSERRKKKRFSIQGQRKVNDATVPACSSPDSISLSDIDFTITSNTNPHTEMSSLSRVGVVPGWPGN